MTILDVFNQIKSQIGNPTGIILIILLIGDEIMGSVPSIKANSWFGLFDALLTTLKQQFLPNQSNKQ